jgi:hypothetical protein
MLRINNAIKPFNNTKGLEITKKWKVKYDDLRAQCLVAESAQAKMDLANCNVVLDPCKE